jgi:hypothetical protein
MRLWRVSRDLPYHRSYFLRYHLEFLVYALWQQLRGRTVRLPVCHASENETVRVKKQIPAVGVSFFGRPILLLVPVVLEYEPCED